MSSVNQNKKSLNKRKHSESESKSSSDSDEKNNSNSNNNNNNNNSNRSSSGSKKKNAPRNTENPNDWPDQVWEKFSSKLAGNVNSKGEKYYIIEKMCPQPEDAPECLRNEVCHNPRGATAITICSNGFEYQRPLHRMRFLLRLRETGQSDKSELQASHLCMNRINWRGRGERQCTNPDHIVPEDDVTNKSRQRCAGWIWIYPNINHQGSGYWYPSCTHSPVCLRYSPRTSVPTLLSQPNSTTEEREIIVIE